MSFLKQFCFKNSSSDSGLGKSSLIECAARLKGKELRYMTLSQATDATDLLGAFEQFNLRGKKTQTGPEQSELFDRN